MKMAIILEADIHHVRGEFTAVHSRVKSLKENGSLDVDAFVVGQYYGPLSTWLGKYGHADRPDNFDLEGVRYRCLWYRRSPLDYLARKLLGRTLGIETRKVRRFARMLGGYDLVWAHALKVGLAALDVQSACGIPAIVTWHGSSIHTDPFNDSLVMSCTRRLLEGARMNLFVSGPLMEKARTMTESFEGKVSHNGVDTSFFTSESPLDGRGHEVAFVGNCLPVKNVGFLPVLFEGIRSRCEDARFHIVGDGSFEDFFKDSGLDVHFLGNMNREDMPAIYNKMSLVVMPSLNEGLPMTCLEATACGCSFVGSRVGGIADVVGEENTVPFSESFEEDFISLCVSRLLNPRAVHLPDGFSLDEIVGEETELLMSIIDGR